MIKHIKVTDQLLEYVRRVSLRESAQLAQLREQTALLEERNMQILPEQGQLMNVLVKLLNASKIIEVGVFTGYSTLCMAEALPSTGRLVACDTSTQWTAIAKPYWESAGVADRIDLRIDEALLTLDKLIEQGESSTFDLVFIDADKENYENYYERSLTLLRTGGLIVFDNMLWSGYVADDSISDPETDALRELNLKLHKDERIDISLLPFADGLTLARKR